VKAMADDVPASAGPAESSWAPVRYIKEPKKRLRHIQWIASKRRWLVRIVRNDRYILNRKFKTIDEAIAARDETLATGRAPPGRAVGGPRKTPIGAWIMRQRARRLKTLGLVICVGIPDAG
jgi:hypothetical protein